MTKARSADRPMGAQLAETCAAPYRVGDAPADADRVDDIRRRLLDWYAVSRRAFPWRGISDPYAILVSEVMLQQTGVERVALTFPAFIELFPTFEALAAAPRVEVLRAWAGLGYNRRAVNLHECARAVVERHGGRLPDTQEELRKLPGIGPYTAAAIRSIAFGQDAAALDTNVRRVVSRVIFGGQATEKQVACAAERLLPAGASSDWNQALMDLGSVLCTVSRPACLVCPLSAECVAAPLDTSTARRAIRERRETYVGSNRYYRGRVVGALRALDSGSSLPIEDLLRRVKPDYVESDAAWFSDLVDGLVDHGLARRVETEHGREVGPPL